MRSILNFSRDYSLVITILLFVASCAVSLYAAEVRFFLTQWPKDKLRKAAAARLRSRLRLLSQLHDNSYELTLWWLWNLTYFLMWALVLYTISAFGYILVLKQHIPGTLPLALVVGTLAGRAVHMHEVINQLYKYKSATESIEQELGRYQVRNDKKRTEAQQGSESLRG